MNADLCHVKIFPITQLIDEHRCGCPDYFFRHHRPHAIVNSATSLYQCSRTYLAVYVIFVGEEVTNTVFSAGIAVFQNMVEYEFL